MSRRIRATHLLTVTRDDQSGVPDDPYNTAPDDGTTTTITQDERVRFLPDGIATDRTALGEEWSGVPVAEAAGDLYGSVKAGDDAAVSPIASGGPAYDDMTVTAVTPMYARRPRPTRVLIRLEDT